MKVSIYDEHEERYRLEELEISERAETFLSFTDKEIITLARQVLEEEESEYIIEEYDLVGKILDYYDKSRRISDKQRYCLCRAIAEKDYFYNEHFDIEYFRKTHLGNEE